MSKWHGGKGSKRRPEDKKKIDANWDKIFGKPKLPDAEEAQKIADQAPHPGKSLYNEIVSTWNALDDVDRALHRVAETDTYATYCLAQQYGHQIHNIIYDRDILGIDETKYL